MLTSPSANAVVPPHGNGIPSRPVKTGPYSVVQIVCVRGMSPPPLVFAITVTLWRSIGLTSPSTMYECGSLGGSVSRNGVKRQAVATVCDQARLLVWPITISGAP